MITNVVALAGGVGGARLAGGLHQVLPDDRLTVIVNTGDDFTFHGLSISPDLDTVCYTLAGIANPEKGWGIQADSYHVLQQLQKLGGESWFSLGDMDIATHLYRTEQLSKGVPLSEVTQQLCRQLGISARVIPMTDDPVKTKVRDQTGEWLDFQEYFVHQQCRPKVSAFKFIGIEHARAAPGVIDALDNAELVVICPSNPWVSIDPILGIREIKKYVTQKCVVAVSPLIGGNAIKGPLAKMFTELGIKPSCVAIAQHYKDFLKGMIIDQVDHAERDAIEAFGIITNTTDILMKDVKDRRRLAQETLEFGETLLNVL